jgi:hypothetical protein
MLGNDRLTAVHEQPEPTDEEQEQTPGRLEEEEPDRDPRQGGGEVPGDRPPEEPIHEA